MFLSGQREVQELVARLRHTFPDKAAKAAQQPSSTSAAKKSHLAAEPVSTTQPDQIPEPLNAAEAGGAEDEHAGLTGGLDAAESSEHPSQVFVLYMPSILQLMQLCLVSAYQMKSWALQQLLQNRIDL